MKEASTTSVTREIWVEASPEAVWQALTHEEKRNQWETRTCSLELKQGGRVELDYGWGVTSSATMIELIPQQKLVTEDDHGEQAIWILTPEGSGTRVSLTYTGCWSGDEGQMIAENMAFGTTLFLKNLKSVFEQKQDLRPTFWRSWLSITHTSIRTDHGNRYTVQQGSLILKVVKGSPSDGLLFPGDVITEANGRRITGYADLEHLLLELEPEASVILTVWRANEPATVDVQLAPYPVSFSS